MSDSVSRNITPLALLSRCAIGLFFGLASQSVLSDPPPACEQGAGCSGSTCASTISPTQATAPIAACPKFGEAQGGVDVFSWNLFVALSWPANNATCQADPNQSIVEVQGNFSGKLVWETFSSDGEVFVTSGKPEAWCQNGDTKTLGHVGKSNHGSRDEVQTNHYFGNNIAEAVGGVLTDQNGRFVRYELLMNKTEYDYITDNGLWNKAGQKNATVNFPSESIEVKAAWKALSTEEIASNRFYMSEATVYNDEKGSPSPGTNPETLGLVGFHLVYKDPKLKHLRASFEHIDNAPTAGSAQMGQPFSFYNPNCQTHCVANKQNASKPYVELDNSGEPLNPPTQVVRTQGLDSNDPGVAALNTYYQKLLGGSVFANYELIGTQWSTGGAPNGTPADLANTTLETYIQAHSPLVDSGAPVSSCIGCHKFATTTAGKSADFSFLLSEAK